MTGTSDQPLVVFSHGKESGPRGAKISALADVARERGVLVESPDYTDLQDPDERVSRLLALPMPRHGRLILAGSSMGGYVSTVASCQLKPCGLFLMAPAFYLDGYANPDPTTATGHVVVVHGWDDVIVPVANAIRFAVRHRASLHLLEADHRLEGALPFLVSRFREFLDAVLADG
jgi:hypothetical protein